nr:hypothetical protein L203_01719 [Cryptococcus depauperatus CBS 7841]
MPFSSFFGSWSKAADVAVEKTHPKPQASSSISTVSKLEAVLKDEMEYQERQYSTVEQVPGCMRLLDEFLMCYALMPQLRNFYRHGEFRDCSWKFQDFKYCMSLKSEDPEGKRELWVKRRAEWWAKRRVGASSEDIWDRKVEQLPTSERTGDE